MELGHFSAFYLASSTYVLNFSALFSLCLHLFSHHILIESPQLIPWLKHSRWLSNNHRISKYKSRFIFHIDISNITSGYTASGWYFISWPKDSYRPQIQLLTCMIPGVKSISTFECIFILKFISQWMTTSPTPLPQTQVLGHHGSLPFLFLFIFCWLYLLSFKSVYFSLSTLPLFYFMSSSSSSSSSHFQHPFNLS